MQVDGADGFGFIQGVVECLRPHDLGALIGRCLSL